MVFPRKWTSVPHIVALQSEGRNPTHSFLVTIDADVFTSTSIGVGEGKTPPNAIARRNVCGMESETFR